MRREDFLARVGRSVMSATLPDIPALDSEMPTLPPTDLVALFRERIREVDGVAHGPVGRTAVPKVVSGIAAGHASSRYLAWDDLPVPGVTSGLDREGLERVDHEVPEQDRKAHQVTYESVDLGVTGAEAGLAESGSVVLSHGPGRPRMASLIPDVHVVLLHVNRMARTISDLARRHPEWVSETANLVFVTGPSRTGDIELHLNLGVHGPRHVHVVMYQ
ncbi:MAG: LUD domain-containing protein [Acidimicrobiia bacterium]|nr:LUD domain-containing protein [Acidimicrobiia bacterium]